MGGIIANVVGQVNPHVRHTPFWREMLDRNALKTRLFDARHHVERAIREDLTWEQLAERISAAHGGRTFTGRQVWAYEKGKPIPTMDVVLAYAQACGVDPGWLAFGDASKAPAPTASEMPRGDAPAATAPLPLRRLEPGQTGADRSAGTGTLGAHREARGRKPHRRP